MWKLVKKISDTDIIASLIIKGKLMNVFQVLLRA